MIESANVQGKNFNMTTESNSFKNTFDVKLHWCIQLYAEVM